MDYQSLKEKIGTGWQTWNNDSVLSSYGSYAETYNAMQTCQAWDTIYNPQRKVPITRI